MPEQRVSVLAVLQDRMTNPLNALARRTQAFFQQIQTKADQLRNPTTPLASFIGGALGIASAQKAIQVAQKQADSIGRLRAAAGGAGATFDRLKKSVDDVASSTGIDDDQLALSAAQMLKIGVAAERIPRALAAAVDTAGALNQPLELVAKALATADVTGSAPRIAQIIPELKALEESGDLAGKAIEVLEEKFAGFATASKDPIFLNLAIAGEALEDQVGRLGRVLAVLRTDLERAFTNVLKILADIAEAPFFQAFLSKVRPIINGVVQIAAGLVGIRIATAGLRLVFGQALGLPLRLIGSLIGVLGFLFSKLGLITAAVGGFGTALFSLTSVGDPLRKVFGDDGTRAALGQTLEALREFGAEVLAGTARLTDFFAVVWKLFGLTAEAFKILLLEPIRANTVDFFTKVVTGLVGLGQYLASPFSEAARKGYETTQKVVDALADGTGGAVGELNRRIERLREDLEQLPRDITNSLKRSAAAVKSATQAVSTADLIGGVVKARSALETLEQQLREVQEKAANLKGIDLSTLFTIDANAARGFLRSAEEELRKPLTDLFSGAFQEQFRQGAITATQLADRVQAIREGEARDESTRLDKAKAEQLQALDKIHERRRKHAEEIAVLESLALAPAIPTAVRADFASRLLALRVETLKEEEKTTAALLATERDRNRNAIQIAEASREDLDLRRQLAEQTADLVSKEVERFSQSAESIRDLVSARRITGAEALSRLEDAAKGLGDEASRARAEVESLLSEGGDETAKDIAEINERIDELTGKAAEARLALAGAIAESVDSASANSRQLRDEARALADEGRISRAELVHREADALAQLDISAQGALISLNEIKATNPELAEQIDVLIERVTGFGDSLRVAIPQGNFFTGFAAGIRQVLAPLDEARELGISLGSSFVDSFASVADVIVGTGRSIQEWVSDFLRGLAQIILRFAILKALGAVFGVTGFSEGGPVPVLSRAGGGIVPGVDMGRDTVPAMLRGGEFIIRPEAVRKYGLGLFHFLNNLAFPFEALEGFRSVFRGISVPAPVMSGHFATGGEVGSRGRESGGGNTLVMDEVTAARIFGNNTAFRQAMRRNADLYKDKS